MGIASSRGWPSIDADGATLGGVVAGAAATAAVAAIGAAVSVVAKFEVASKCQAPSAVTTASNAAKHRRRSPHSSTPPVGVPSPLPLPLPPFLLLRRLRGIASPVKVGLSR